MPPSTRSAKSSASSTPVPISRSPKRRRLSRNAPGPLPARSSSPDELASAQWDDSATPRAVLPTPARATRRTPAAVVAKESADVRRRRSRDDDAAAAGPDDGSAPAPDEESPDELGDEVHHFWRAAANGAPAARTRDGGRAARMKAFAERSARRRVARPEQSPLAKAEESPTVASPTPLPDGAEEGEQGAEQDERHGDAPEEAAAEAERRPDMGASPGESRAENPEDARAESHGESRGGSPREPADGEEREESPAEEEQPRETERQLALEQERMRERERDAEKELARRSMFRPYQAEVVLKGHCRGVAAVRFSPDGGRAASCCEFLDFPLLQSFIAFCLALGEGLWLLVDHAWFDRFRLAAGSS